MQQIIPNPPPRFQQWNTYPASLTRLPICGLVLLVSLPAALLTAIIMGFVHMIRLVTRSF